MHLPRRASRHEQLLRERHGQRQQRCGIPLSERSLDDGIEPSAVGPRVEVPGCLLAAAGAAVPGDQQPHVLVPHQRRPAPRAGGGVLRADPDQAAGSAGIDVVDQPFTKGQGERQAGHSPDSAAARPKPRQSQLPSTGPEKGAAQDDGGLVPGREQGRDRGTDRAAHRLAEPCPPCVLRRSHQQWTTHSWLRGSYQSGNHHSTRLLTPCQ